MFYHVNLKFISHLDLVAASGTPPRSRSPVSPRRPLEQGKLNILQSKICQTLYCYTY